MKEGRSNSGARAGKSFRVLGLRTAVPGCRFVATFEGCCSDSYGSCYLS